MGSFNLKRRLFIMISLVAIIFSSFSAFSSSHNTGEAYGACKQVGSFMGLEDVGSDSSGVPNADIGNRKWTAEELFRGTVSFSSFYGEGEGTLFFAEKLNRGESIAGWSEDVQSKFESSRKFSCSVAGMDFVPQMFLSMSSGITAFSSALISILVGSDKLVETVASIVGGEGNGDEGLIGTFFNSFYSPLVIIAFILMTVTLVYKGLIKMQFREALNSIIWSFLAFIIGVALMLNPQMLAGAPQAVTSTITTCVLGALSGQNCMSGEVTTPGTLAGLECLSTVGDGGNQTQSAVNSLNCTIWKAFVLDPWAESQFGVPYKDLYTKDPPEGGSIWKSLPEDTGDKYCINMSTVKSHAESVSGIPTMDGNGGTVCNVALYQLFLKTMIIDNVNQSGNNYDSDVAKVTDDTGVYDSRWYSIAIPMAQDESKWRYWSGDGMFFERLGTGMLSFIGVIAASTVLVTLALFGGAYKLIGTLLIAFAPVFFLLAIEPTKGKRMFLGWLETLVSSFLKYFAITVLIIVALIMYAGILANTSGIYSLVGIIVMTVALHMYRKEIVDLIGASNMGGEKLSNKVNELGSKAGKFAKEKGSAVVGGALGGGIAGMGDRSRSINARKDTISQLQKGLKESSNEEEKKIYRQQIKEEEAALEKESSALNFVKTAAEGTLSGAKDSTERSFKRGTGVAANILSQKGRTAKELEKRAEEDKKVADERKSKFEAKLAEVQNPNNEDFDNDGPQGPPTGPGNNGNGNNGPGNNGNGPEMPPVAPDREIAIEELIDSQREAVTLPEELSEEERNALNEFADKLQNNSVSDSELVQMANAEDNPHKKELVANEINARVRANSMMGIASNVLSRSELVNPAYLSDEELSFNLRMHSENFLETGDERELSKYLSAGSEIAQRSGGEFDTDTAKERMEDLKARVGDTYQRNIEFPTESEVDAMGNEYSLRINENTSIDAQNVSTPETLATQASGNSELIDRARGIEPTPQEQGNGTLPNLENLENSEGTPSTPNVKTETPASTTTLPSLDEDPIVQPKQEAPEPRTQGGTEQGQTQAQPEVQPQQEPTVPNPKVESQSQPEVQQQEPTVPNQKVETQSQPEVQQQEPTAPNPKVETQSQPEVQGPTGPNPKVETQAQPEVQQQGPTVTNPKVETQPEVQGPTAPNPKVESQPQPEVQQQQGPTATNPKVETQSQPEVQQQTVTQPQQQQAPSQQQSAEAPPVEKPAPPVEEIVVPQRVEQSRTQEESRRTQEQSNSSNEAQVKPQQQEQKSAPQQAQVAPEQKSAPQQAQTVQEPVDPVQEIIEQGVPITPIDQIGDALDAMLNDMNSIDDILGMDETPPQKPRRRDE